MRPIEKYLEEVKKKAGLRTDRALAEKLGIRPQAIVLIKQGVNTPCDETCKKLAELIGDPPEKVLLLAQISKAPDVTRPAWERIFQAMAFMAVVTVAAAAAPSASNAAARECHISDGAYSGYYVKSRRRRKNLPLSYCTA